MLTKDEILAVILKLSQPDLEAIYAVVSSLINARTGPRTKPPPEHAEGFTCE